MFNTATYTSADLIIGDRHAMRADNYRWARELTEARMRGEKGPRLRRFSWVYIEDIANGVRRLYEISTSPHLLKVLDFDWKINVHAIIGALEKRYPDRPLQILWKVDIAPPNVGSHFHIYRNDLLVKKTNNPDKGTKGMHFTLTPENWETEIAIIRGKYRDWPVKVWVKPEEVRENLVLWRMLDELGFIAAQEQWNIHLRKESEQ